MTRLRTWVALAALVVGLPALAFAGEAGVPAPERARLEALKRSESDFKLGLEAQRRGRYEVARDAYEAALAADENFVEAMVNLARTYAAMGELEEAGGWLDRAARLRSDYPGVAAGRGLVALARGDTDLAIEELTRARVVAPDDVEVLTNLGAALVRAGLWREAIEHLDRAQRLDPHRGTPSLNLGLAYDGAGDTDRAAFHYGRFLELTPSGDALRGRVEARISALDAHDSNPPAKTNDLMSTSTTETASTLKGASQ